MSILQVNMSKKQEITQFRQNPGFFSGDKIKSRVIVISSSLSLTRVDNFGK